MLNFCLPTVFFFFFISHATRNNIVTHSIHDGLSASGKTGTARTRSLRAIRRNFIRSHICAFSVVIQQYDTTHNNNNNNGATDQPNSSYTVFIK